ncbi:uncharacterized protein V6R79_002137 [Siganus canaliculatus]
MLLHIVLSDDSIQRVCTEGLSETLDELKMMLKTCLGGQFYNLNMDDLPSERVKLKVIMKAPPSNPQYTLHTGHSELGHIQSVLKRDVWTLKNLAELVPHNHLLL